jgi:hypothetical protein
MGTLAPPCSRPSPRWPRGSTAHTVLTGLLDQSALFGVLAEIEALGLELIEVRQLTPERELRDGQQQADRGSGAVTVGRLRSAVDAAAC